MAQTNRKNWSFPDQAPEEQG